MIRKTIVSSQALSGLRTRYFPKSRIGQGLVSMAPWLNIVLLLIFFAILDARFVLQPGVVIQLPEAPFAEGLRSGLTAVVLSLETGVPGVREEAVIFDDARFQVSNASQMKRLKQALTAGAYQHPSWGLVILADRHAQVDTVIRLMDMAREAGIKTVNLGTRETAAREAVTP